MTAPTRRWWTRSRVLGAAVAVTATMATAGCAATDPGVAGPGGSTVGTTAPAAAPVDFSRPGPHAVGTRTIAISKDPCPTEPEVSFGCPRSAVVFYPADPDSAGRSTKVTGYSTSMAFPDTLRALVPSELIQDISLGIAVFEQPVVDDEGPFPVVLHSHGFGGYYRFESAAMAHLASWGFVVAAPDHQERSLSGQLAGGVPEEGADVDDLRATLEVLKEENVADGPLHGGIDPSRVAASGHSAGGSAAARLAMGGGVATFIGKAPGPPIPFRPEDAGGAPASPAGPADPAVTTSTEGVPERLAAVTPPPVPSLLIASDLDGVIPLSSVEAEYEWLQEPKRLVVLRNAGHNAFTDLCQPIRDRGGLMQYADELPSLAAIFQLGEDGCTPDRLDPAKGAALIDHVMVAHLRQVLGMDATDASLREPFLRARFPDALASTRSSP